MDGGFDVTFSGKVARIDSLAGLAEMAPRWATLERDALLPTCDLAWASAYARHVRADRLHVLVACGDEGADAIAPLVRAAPGDRLELLGVRELGEPTDFLYREPSSVEPIAEALARSGSGLFLPRLPAESPVGDALRAAYRGRGVVVRRRVSGSPTIALDESWTAPERRLNSGRRSDLRRARRRAEALGPVRFEMHTPAPQEVPELLRDAFAIEASGWKGRAGTALAHDRRRGRFFTAYSSSVAADRRLRVAFLAVGDRRVAMQLGVTKRDRLWLLKMGYDDAYRACSPGTLLMVEVIRWAAAGGLGGVELLGVPEPWTRAWTSQVRPQVALVVYPAKLRALPHLALDGISLVGRKLERDGRPEPRGAARRA